MSQLDIELADGQTIHLDNADGGDVLLAISLPAGVVIEEGVLLRLNPAVAAYLAGQLAVRSGVFQA